MCGLVMKKKQLKNRGGFIMYMIILSTTCIVRLMKIVLEKTIKYSKLILSRLANWKDARINQKETRMSEDKEDFSGSYITN